MLQHVQAVYEDGVFRPLAPVGLPEQSHVTLNVAPADPETPAISDDEFDRQLEALSTDGPTLPADFSRSDIYAENT
jgi:predicted DNA-binding antitoxin AbrB/MazE fold protein